MENLQTLREKPLWQMTGAEFLALQSSQTQPSQVVLSKEKNLVRGINGIAQLFGCSMATAWKIQRSGVIDAAISRVGRKIVVDADMALELAKKRKSKKIS